MLKLLGVLFSKVLHGYVSFVVLVLLAKTAVRVVETFVSIGNYFYKKTKKFLKKEPVLISP